MRRKLLQHGIFSRVTATLHKRCILDISHYKNTHHLTKTQTHLSPFTGMVFAHTPALRHFYSEAQNSKHPSATAQVVLMLFHEQESKFRQTYNKSSAAYSLSPSILGRLVKHLNDNTLQDPVIKEAIINDWAKQHIAVAGARVSKIKIINLISLLQQSLSECQMQQYPSHFIYHLLTAFLHYKAEKPADIDYYINALSVTVGLSRVDKFTNEDIQRGNHKLDTLTFSVCDAHEVDQHMENIAIALMHNEFKLKTVLDADYGYQDQEPVANCVEAAYHNLCNILFYDEGTLRFSPAILPETVTPHPDLFNIYAKSSFDTTQINYRETGQAFMNLLSGNAKFTYCQKNYELETTVNDFIPIMNYLFGINASSYAELSKAFSSDTRQITFRREMDNIDIEILGVNAKRITAKFRFGITHAALQTEFFAGRRVQENPTCEIVSDFAITNIRKYSLLFMATNLAGLLNYDDHRHVPVTDLIELVNHMIYYRRYWLCNNHEINILEMLAKLYRHSPETKDKIKFIIAKYQNILVSAIHSRKLAIVEFLLEMGVGPNVTSRMGLPPLSDALRTKKPEIARLLLRYGANPHWTSEQGENYLHSCAYRPGMTELIPLFVGLGIDIHSASATEKYTALQYAVMGNQLANLKKLIELGANLEATNVEGDTALMLAVKYNHHEIVGALLNAGANNNHVNKLGRTALHYAVMNGDISNTRLLLEYNADPNIYDEPVGSPLAYTKKYEIVRMLLAKGASHLLSQTSHLQLIHLAANMGFPTLLTTALAGNANPNALTNNISPMMFAIMGDHDDMINALSAAGANLDETCVVMLHHLSPFLSHERYLDLRMRCKSCIKETETKEHIITIRLGLLHQLMNGKNVDNLRQDNMRSSIASRRH